MVGLSLVVLSLCLSDCIRTNPTARDPTVNYVLPTCEYANQPCQCVHYDGIQEFTIIWHILMTAYCILDLYCEPSEQVRSVLLSVWLFMVFSVTFVNTFLITSSGIFYTEGETVMMFCGYEHYNTCRGFFFMFLHTSMHIPLCTFIRYWWQRKRPDWRFIW
jgi:hypothetical protein